MPPLRLAIALRSLRLPFRQALPVAAQMGAQAVEIDARGEINPQAMTQTALRQVRKLLADQGLQVAAVEFHTRRGYGVTDDQSRRVEATKAAMTLAQSLGAAVVVNQVGRVPDDSAGREFGALVEVLGDLGNFGQRVGALLAAETGSESGADLRRLIDALPAGSLGVTLNPGNLIVNGFSPLDAIDVLARDLLHVHASDGVHDRARGRGTEVSLGRGSSDYPALLGALDQHGYRGYLGIVRESAADPVSEIAQATQYLRSL
jgi:sugar phosphate isomerase/epimerase